MIKDELGIIHKSYNKNNYFLNEKLRTDKKIDILGCSDSIALFAFLFKHISNLKSENISYFKKIKLSPLLFNIFFKLKKEDKIFIKAYLRDSNFYDFINNCIYLSKKHDLSFHKDYKIDNFISEYSIIFLEILIKENSYILNDENNIDRIITLLNIIISINDYYYTKINYSLYFISLRIKDSINLISLKNKPLKHIDHIFKFFLNLLSKYKLEQDFLYFITDMIKLNQNSKDYFINFIKNKDNIYYIVSSSNEEFFEILINKDILKFDTLLLLLKNSDVDLDEDFYVNLELIPKLKKDLTAEHNIKKENIFNF